jgi:hypothetical protein
MHWFLSLIAVFVFLAAASSFAEEVPHAPPATTEEAGAHGGEKKPAAPDKPRPDSVISSVLSLPVVKKWGEWMEAKDNGSKIVAWGEYIKKVRGSDCWSIVVGEENAKENITVWKRFCMQQSGLEMWVESTMGANSTDEINYITYDNWRTSCAPTHNSPGIC